MTAGISWLDIKLGVRTLIKFPLLTVVGGVSITVAVVLAAGWFEFSWDLNSPALPFEDSDRLVRVWNHDVTEGDADAPSVASLHDFEAWRGELESIRGLSAVLPFESTIGTEDRRSRVIDGARVTASTFRVLRVAPVLGRRFVEADMDPGAPSTVVIGNDLWRRFFDSDSSAIGRTVRLGTATSTIVGVMPEGFRFPGNEELWVPLRENAGSYERGDGPAVLAFGRLAQGFEVEAAQAELTAIGARMAAEFSATHETLRPRVGPLVDAGWEARFAAGANLMFILLLVVICANVAILVFARTATREGEIAMRSALGASRRRLVLQLCTEALVLTAGSAAVGLAIAGWGIEQAMDLFFEVQRSTPPYWWDTEMSWATVLYIMALAVVGAAVVGGIPALRATGRRVGPALSRLGSGGSALSFGRMSTVVIVMQVALCVIFLPLAYVRGQELLEEAGATTVTSRFPADEHLSGRLTRDVDVPPGGPTDRLRAEILDRTGELQDEVRRRLAAAAGVSAITFYGRLPGFNHPVETVLIEGDEDLPADTAAERAVRSLTVDLNFFDVANTSLLAGRVFSPADLESELGVAVVSQQFVRDELDGRNALGRRLRFPGRGDGEGNRWYEIVGVVQDPALIASSPGEYVGLYHPLAPGDEVSIRFLLHTPSGTRSMVPRIRSLIASVDPSLVIEDLQPLSNVWRPVQRSDVSFTAAIGVVVAIALLLSLAGIYALMSFTVAQRVREIGVRAALGAGPPRLIAEIFRRALAQIGLGVLAGVLILSLTIADTGLDFRLVAGVAALMMGIGVLACVLPARRAVRIQPTEALRADA